jgi:hypothetical protein
MHEINGCFAACPEFRTLPLPPTVVENNDHGSVDTLNLEPWLCPLLASKRWVNQPVRRMLILMVVNRSGEKLFLFRPGADQELKGR